MCAPDETSIALASMFDNAAAYDLCMLKKGYDEAIPKVHMIRQIS